jgi:endonuclease/exonuclease/phosphatase (EEP) superfamily protein YafD
MTRIFVAAFLAFQGFRVVAEALALDGLLVDQIVSFKPQWFLLTAIVAPILLVKRYPILLMAAIAVIGFDGYGLAHWFVPTVATPTKVEETAILKVMHANVLYGNTQHQPILDLLRHEQPQIAFLVETDMTWQKEFELLRDIFPHQTIYGVKPDGHAAILSRCPLRNIEFKEIGDPLRPLFITDFLFQGQNLTFAAAHLSAPMNIEKYRMRNQSLDLLAAEMAGVRRPVILLSDLNTSPWSMHYQHFVEETGLHNAAQGSGHITTWHVPYTPIFSPIDHIFFRQPPLQVRDYYFGSDIGSDHRPLIAHFALSFARS